MADESNKPIQPDAELLPVEQKPAPPTSDELIRFAASITRSGPLPDSREFAAYEKTLPGAADRILRMAERQSEHRMVLEKSVILGNIVNERLGLACAVTSVVATLGATIWLAQLGLGAWGLAAVLAEVSGIVLAVRHITNKNTEERRRKAELQRKLDAEE